MIEEKRSLMMLLIRNRSRAVTKPPLMADHHSSSSQQSNNQTYVRTIIPSLFGSPKFVDFTNKNSLSGTEALRSPTSILDTKALISPFGFFGNPFSHANNNKSSQNKSTSIHKIDSTSIGLALVSALKDEPFDENSGEPNKGTVLFGTQLRLKIKDSQNKDFNSPREVVERVVSMSEMELSEEYTCVISHHGPNPRTTHIFNNCIVEESYFSVPKNSHLYANSESFLSFCYTCKKHLDHTKDIFIYRGEKAFCSPECRYREMVLDDNSECDGDGDSRL